MDSLKIKNAYKTLLEKSLLIYDSSKVITVIYDEDFFLKYFKYFAELINELKLKVAYIFIPENYQNVLLNNKEFIDKNGIQLPPPIKSAISSSDIVLNFLSGSAKSSGVRSAILNGPIKYGCKIAHCPNISDDILELILESPFEEINKHCELFAWLIGNSHSAKIITRSPEGKEFELLIKLDGWGVDPFISSGVISEGSWGNVPPGETFCCPEPKSINGDICINGSLPSYGNTKGYVLKDGDFLQLTFKKGKMVKWDSNNLLIKQYMQNLESDSDLKNDSNWNTFAELGIGLNSKIKALTGNPLFDEKMANSIHIAIGGNTMFGRPIQSKIHLDLVCLNPTLFLGKKKVIDWGKILFNDIQEWKDEFNPKKRKFSSTDKFEFVHAKMYFTGNEIKRRLVSGSRIGHLTVFTTKINIQSIFSENKETAKISYNEIVKKFEDKKIEIDEMKKILEILIHYKMIKVHKP